MNILIACFSQTGNRAKVHTRNIYGKLGTHSRTQAIARAKAQDDTRRYRLSESMKMGGTSKLFVNNALAEQLGLGKVHRTRAFHGYESVFQKALAGEIEEKW